MTSPVYVAAHELNGGARPEHMSITGKRRVILLACMHCNAAHSKATLACIREQGGRRPVGRCIGWAQDPH